MAKWPISEPPDDAWHRALIGARHNGFVTFRFDETDGRQAVEILFGGTELVFRQHDGEWTFELCADGRFRCDLYEDGGKIGSAVLELVKITGEQLVMRGTWTEQEDAADVSIETMPTD